MQRLYRFINPKTKACHWPWTRRKPTMATTAEFIGVYIADIITTATITIIVATIITITAIGETCRVVAVSKLALRRARVAAHAAAFPFSDPRPDHTKNSYQQRCARRGPWICSGFR